MGLSLRQWLLLLKAAPEMVAEVRAALPVIMPLVKRIMALVEELELDKPMNPAAVITPKALVERSHGLSPEEKALFDRIRPE